MGDLDPSASSHCCDNDHEVAVVCRTAQQVWGDTREEGLREGARGEDVEHVPRLEGGKEGGKTSFARQLMYRYIHKTLVPAFIEDSTLDMHETEIDLLLVTFHL